MAETFIIAEVGVNHNGSTELAKKLIDAAAACGADAVKFQSFIASEIATDLAPQAKYQVTGARESQLEMLDKLQLTFDQQRELFDYCRHKEIEFLSTPFDQKSLAFLVSDLQLTTIKIGSGEITNAPFLLDIARCAEKIILSTGMSTLEEVRSALEVIAFGMTQHDVSPNTSGFKTALQSDLGREAVRKRVTLLHCTTDYPTVPQDVNLRAMSTLKTEFGCTIGFSDHSLGVFAALGAVARGAKVIEKHLTLDRNMPGPDHQASLEPHGFLELVTGIRAIELALGSPTKSPTSTELENQKIARKSIVALVTIKQGEEFNIANIGIKRPGNGRSPFEYWKIIGTKADREFSANELI